MLFEYTRYIHLYLSFHIFSRKVGLYLKIKLSIPDTTVRQEGGLQDIAIEVLHLLLAQLVRTKEQFGIGADQKEAFLTTLRKGIIYMLAYIS